MQQRFPGRVTQRGSRVLARVRSGYAMIKELKTTRAASILIGRKAANALRAMSGPDGVWRASRMIGKPQI